jgi:hypothetical protein
MHLVYSQGKEVTPENDEWDIEDSDCYLNMIYRPHLFKTFKKKFGRPDIDNYILIDNTTQKVTRKQEGFLVLSYFINPSISTCICFGEYL